MQLSYYIHENPLRAGIVRRLIDYRWSSYPAYAYNRRHPNWLNKDLILSQIQGEDKHRQYRESTRFVFRIEHPRRRVPGQYLGKHRDRH